MLLRITGKRTLAKLNAFDFIVTVAMGSALGQAVTSLEVGLVTAISALGLLVGLQFVVAWCASRWSRVKDLVTARPRLLFERGEFFEKALLDERVTRSEVLAAVREAGLGSLEDVEAVVLETAGTLSVLPRRPGGPGPLLDGVRR